MHNSYSLKYRTFDQLYEDVAIDFRKYNLEGTMNPEYLLKIARKCNYDLGFRIYRTRQIILEVDRGRVRLPDDFHIMNFAVVCGESTVTEAYPQGTNIEERLVAPEFVCQPATIPSCETPAPDPCSPVDPCNSVDPCTNTCITKCGDEYELVQKINTFTHTYKTTFPLIITDNERIDKSCLDGVPRFSSKPKGYTGLVSNGKGPINEARIENGFLMTNFDTGNVYINYMGDMIDDDGNIMVPDHEMINEYYEYALKERILENLVMSGENVANQFQLVNQKLRIARNYALTIVNTPNFQEMQKLWRVNRNAQYHNYYNMFKSY